MFKRLELCIWCAFFRSYNTKRNFYIIRGMRLWISFACLRPTVSLITTSKLSKF